MRLWTVFQSKLQFKLMLIFITVFGLALIASTSALMLAIGQLSQASIQRQLLEEQLIIDQRFAEVQTRLLQTALLMSQEASVLGGLTHNEQGDLNLNIGNIAATFNHDALWILNTDADVVESFAYSDQSQANPNLIEFDSLISQVSQPQIQMLVQGQTALMLAIVPVYNQEQQIIGFSVASDVIDDQVLGHINFHRDYVALVIFPGENNIDGISATESNQLPHLSSGEVEDLRLNGALWEQIRRGEPIRLLDVQVRGTLHALIYQPLMIDGEFNGYYVMAIDENEARTLQNVVVQVSFSSIFVILFLCGLLIIVSLWRFVLRPLQTLRSAAHQFGDGRLDVYISSDNPDEIGELYATFNQMAISIASRTRELNKLNSELEARVRERTIEVEIQTQWLETIVCQATEAIIVLNPDGNISIINAVALSILELEEAVALGQSLVELLENIANQQLRLPDKDTRQLGELEVNQRFYKYSIAPIRLGSTKHMSGYVSILSDITTLRRLNNLQTQVIRLAAHDLRSPVTALGLQFQLLRRNPEPLSARQNSILERLEAIVLEMRAMINDLLNVEHIEQQVSGISETIVLESLVSSALSLLDGQFSEKQQQVTVELEDNLPLLCGDPVRLLEVLRNLLSNAYKYTSHGGKIVFRAYRCDERLCVEVSDSGIGIDEEDLPQIFNTKFRAKTALESGIDGHGIGLSLTREIIQEHGGQISVTSQKGSGSTFKFYLPLP